MVLSRILLHLIKPNEGYRQTGELKDDIDQLIAWGKEKQPSKHYFHGGYLPLPVSMAAFIRRS